MLIKIKCAVNVHQIIPGETTIPTTNTLTCSQRKMVFPKNPFLGARRLRNTAPGCKMGGSKELSGVSLPLMVWLSKDGKMKISIHLNNGSRKQSFNNELKLWPN